MVAKLRLIRATDNVSGEASPLMHGYRSEAMRVFGLILLAGIFVVAVLRLAPESVAAAQAPTAQGVPAFKLDPSWPKPLPNHWMLGVVWGVATDSRDHVWIIQDPKGDWPKGDKTKEWSRRRLQLDAGHRQNPCRTWDMD
jgi:hypothetical protein